MIVYVVARKWFTMKDDAERHRKTEGLKPADTLKIEIKNREELALLLNALCAASPAAIQAAQKVMPDNPVAEVVDRAYVDVGVVPSFLLRGREDYREELERRERKGDVFG